MKTHFTVRIGGNSHLLDCEDGETFLEAMLRQGLNPSHSCCVGVCCSCRAQLISGKVQHSEDSALDENEIQNGSILTCQSRPEVLSAGDSAKVEFVMD